MEKLLRIGLFRRRVFILGFIIPSLNGYDFEELAGYSIRGEAIDVFVTSFSFLFCLGFSVLFCFWMSFYLTAS